MYVFAGRSPRALKDRIRRLNRKTYCFSCKESLHDNVLGEYLSRMWYHPACNMIV
ncbi:IS1 family transposase [Kistimonas scapharcae]|uniref:IS1 family transposase n=1 Tax=Kistimonas scapharcae TaxID=1036133 RepID=UPI003CD08ECB